MATVVEIPKRAFFKSADVCAVAGVQPYVLKSWEAEFPSLGGKKRKDGSLVYGRQEVELVLQIKELVYGEGLTLGAARRKLQEEEENDGGGPESEPSFQDLVGDETHERLRGLKRGLREILDLLSGNGIGAVQEPLHVDAVTPEPTVAPAKKSKPKIAKTTQARSSRGRLATGRAPAKRKRRTA